MVSVSVSLFTVHICSFWPYLGIGKSLEVAVYMYLWPEVTILDTLNSYGHKRQEDIPELEFRVVNIPDHQLEVLEKQPWHNLLSYPPRLHFPRQESVSPSVWIYFCFQS